MKKKFKILITWRLMIDNIENYKKIFAINNISYDFIYIEQG